MPLNMLSLSQILIQQKVVGSGIKLTTLPSFQKIIIYFLDSIVLLDHNAQNGLKMMQEHVIDLVELILILGA